jgi:hypothetical protein
MSTIKTLDSASLSLAVGGKGFVDPCLSKGITAGVEAQREYPGLSPAKSDKVFETYRKFNERACRSLERQGIKQPGVF